MRPHRGLESRDRIAGRVSNNNMIVTILSLLHFASTCLGQVDNETSAFNRDMTNPLIDLIYSNGAISTNWDVNIVESADTSVSFSLPSLMSTNFEFQAGDGSEGSEGGTEVTLFAFLNENDALKFNTTNAFDADHNLTIAYVVNCYIEKDSTCICLSKFDISLYSFVRYCDFQIHG